MKQKNIILSFLLSSGLISGAFAASNTIPASEHVKYIFSGGDPRGYSDATQKNHRQYAHYRGVGYRFVDFNNQKSPIVKALGNKQKYWGKIFTLQKAMNLSRIPEGSWVAWADDDIVINDINNNRTMMDRIIDKHGAGKSLIVSSEKIDWIYLNTGIVLVKKDEAGRNLLNKLIEKSDDQRLGYETQANGSLHEQEALKELVLGKNGVFDKDQDGTLFKEYIAVAPQRDGDLNFNNFRRYSHYDKSRKVNLVYTDDPETKALDTDAFIHHTGMETWRRSRLIEDTLVKINKQTDAFLVSADLLPDFTLVSGTQTDDQLKQEQLTARQNARAAAKASLKARNVNAAPKASQNTSDFIMVSAQQSDAELKQAQATARQNARAAAKASLKARNVNAASKAPQNTTGFIMVSAQQSDAELKQAQATARQNAKAAAKASLKARKLTATPGAIMAPNTTPNNPYSVIGAPSIPKPAPAASKASQNKAPDFVMVSATQSDDQLKQEQATARQNAKAEAKAMEYLYQRQQTARFKAEAENSIQEFQSLGRTTSMMALTALSGLSSVMSSYRSGRAFSFGMASIDDIPVSEMLASTGPSRSQVISRETGSWHNFVQLHAMRGNRKDVNDLPGGSINGQALSAGAFYQINSRLVAGMMLAVSKNSMNFNQGGEGKVTSISVGPFMSYTLDDWHVDAALSVARDSYELSRKSYTGSGLKSEFSGSTLSGYLATGYDIHLDHWVKGLTLTPMTELMLIHSRHGAYREKGNDKDALQIKSARNNQLITRLGFEAGYLFPNLETPTEIKTRLGIQHQTMSAQNARYQLPTGNTGQLTVPAMNERSLFTGIGIQRQIGEQSKIALNYNGNLSKTGNSHGFQLEFESKF